MTSNLITKEARLTPIATLVIWTTWLAVGIAGLLLPYPRPIAPPRPPAPVLARIINVQVTEQTRPPPDVRQPLPQQPEVDEPSPPPPPGQLALPAAPQMAEIAVPAPAVAFAVPTTQPARVVPPSQVTTARPAPVAAVTPEVRHLTYGVGEGVQPAPDYPIEAQLDEEQGTVVIRLEVAEDGHVTSARAISPCPWPLLNQSALRAVRQTWQFAPGPIRSYDVAIQYKGQGQ